MAARHKIITCVFCGDEELRHPRTRMCNGCRPLLKRAAYRADTELCRAISHGLVPPPEDFKCADCGRGAQAYDHRDYDRPLDVQPVCYSCNLKRGSVSAPEALRLHIAKRRAVK